VRASWGPVPTNNAASSMIERDVRVPRDGQVRGPLYRLGFRPSLRSFQKARFDPIETIQASHRGGSLGRTQMRRDGRSN
jgi:hypothetical protein